MHSHSIAVQIHFTYIFQYIIDYIINQNKIGCCALRMVLISTLHWYIHPSQSIHFITLARYCHCYPYIWIIRFSQSAYSFTTLSQCFTLFLRNLIPTDTDSIQKIMFYTHPFNLGSRNYSKHITMLGHNLFMVINIIIYMIIF